MPGPGGSPGRALIPAGAESRSSPPESAGPAAGECRPRRAGGAQRPGPAGSRRAAPPALPGMRWGGSSVIALGSTGPLLEEKRLLRHERFHIQLRFLVTLHLWIIFFWQSFRNPAVSSDAQRDSHMLFNQTFF